MRSSAVTLLAGILAIGLVGCATSKISSSKSQPSGFVANVGYRNVETKVAVRRWKSPLALGVVVGQKVQDQFTVEPSLHMANHYTEYRKTIGAALQRVFGENFANVAVADKESGSGLELVVTRAEMQPSMTIKFGLSLLQNGRELLDVVGESEGKTVAMRGNRDTLFEKYDGAIEEVTDFALASFAEKVYDAVMRSKKLEADGTYDRLMK